MRKGNKSGKALIFPLYLVFIILFPCPFLGAQDADTVPVPLYIDDIYAGEISAAILPDESVQLRPSELIAYLRDLLSEETIQTAEMIFPAEGWLNLTDMGGLGVRIVFKFEDLTLHVYIPAHLRRENVISLTGKEVAPAGKEITKQDFSAFFNLGLWSRIIYETITFDYSVTPELGMNIYDWIAEVRGGVRSGSEPFFLDYARVIHDFSALSYTLEIGDVSWPVTGLTGISNITGASFRRNTRIDPDYDDSLPYTKEIFLREPSRVEIYLNDIKIKEADYQSGTYIFNDFQLSRGINRISIKWQDSEGPHTEEMIIPYENSLLKTGELDMGISAGIPDRNIVLPVVSSHQYAGLTDSLTMGLTEGYNSDNSEISIAADFLYSTNFGTFRLYPEWGMIFGGGMKTAVELGYQYLNTGNDYYWNFGTTTGYRTDAILYAPETVSSFYSDNYTTLLFPGGFSLTPRFFWEYRIEEAKNVFKLRGSFKKSIRGGSSISATVGVEWDEGPAFSGTVSFSSSFPEVNQNLYLLENLDTQKLSAYWNKYASDAASDYTLNVSAEIPIELDERLSLGARAGYIHSLFNGYVSHDFDTIIAAEETSNSTSISAESGIVYTGGYLALTAPVRDSFIIIAPSEQFRDNILDVNPGTSSNITVSDSPGVLSGINSYSVNKINIEAQELIPGMDDRNMMYHFTPSYKSGAVIYPEIVIRVYTGGYITDEEGTALGMKPGILTAETSEGEPHTVEFFTDKKGYFEAYNLEPGRYILKLAGFENTQTIEIKESETGYFDSGTIVIKGKGR